MKLYSYWRSTAAYRVRIALNLKQLDYQMESVHLVKDGGQQFSEDYTRLNPQSLVPALVTESGDVLTQSLAIIDYLDEEHSQFPLYPYDAVKKAQVKAMALSIVCDIHPLNNLRVLKKLKSMGLSQESVDQWYHEWIHTGFAAMEKQLQQTSGIYCFGDSVSVADICLVAQVYNANRFSVDLETYPLIRKINAACLKLEAFIDASPENQPDCEN